MKLLGERAPAEAHDFHSTVLLAIEAVRAHPDKPSTITAEMARKITAALDAGVTPAAAAAGPDHPELQKTIGEIVDSGFVGVSLRVHDERGEWAGSAGTAELGGTAKPPANGHHRIGSITKTFTATLVLHLVAEGRFGLDDPVVKHLPEFGLDERITVRMLLQHTSGVFTIGQAAAFVGVTVKTVRHYHKLGLVEEPERDTSGYRRYASADLLRLVQVRTLAEAGVPLAEIGAMLDADATRFAAALADVERQLTERIDELTARRDTLHRLADGDRALLPDRAVALLERMPGLGFTADEVAATRDGWVLARALVPEGFDDSLTHFEHAVQDTQLVALTRHAAEAARWEPDDPRIAELATAAAGHYLANPALLKTVTGLRARTEAATRYTLIAHHGEEQTPAAARLTALFEAKLRAAGIHIPRPDSH